MSHVLPKRLAGVIASVVAFAIIAPSTLLSVKADNNDKVQLGSFEYATATNLGGANAFSVFAKNYTDTTSDMEGVIAVDSVEFGGQDFGASNKVSKYLVDGYNLNYIGSNISGTITNIRPAEAFIFPDEVTITTGSGAPNNGNGVRLSYDGIDKDFNGINNIISSGDPAKITNVSKSTFTIDFDKAFNALKEYSSYAYGQNPTAEVSNDGNKLFIKCYQGLNYISIDSSILAADEIYIDGVNNITDYSLIINVTGLNGDVCLSHIMMIDGKANSDGEGYGEQAGKLLWNFGPNYSGTVTFVSCEHP